MNFPLIPDESRWETEPTPAPAPNPERAALARLVEAVINVDFARAPGAHAVADACGFARVDLVAARLEQSAAVDHARAVLGPPWGAARKEHAE